MPGRADPVEAAGRELQAQAIARAIAGVVGDATEWIGSLYQLRNALGVADRRFVGAEGMKAFAREIVGGRVAAILREQGIKPAPAAVRGTHPAKARVLFSRPNGRPPESAKGESGAKGKSGAKGTGGRGRKPAGRPMQR